MPEDLAPLARLAALVENGPRLRNAIRLMQPHVDPTRYDEIEEEICVVDGVKPVLPG